MKIVNKIVASLLCVASFPLLITQMFFNIVLSVDRDSAAYSLLNLILGEENILTNNRLGIQYSLSDIFDMVIGKTQNEFGFDFAEFFSTLPKECDGVKKLLIASMIFVALGALVAIIVIGCALLTKAYKTVIALSLGSSLSYLIAIILFGQAGKPFFDGTIDVVSLIGGMLSNGEASTIGSMATSMLKGVINVDTFALGGAVFGAMIMMFAVAIWEFAYVVTLPAEERPKKKVKTKKAVK